ncbi:MAG TPA: AMP-binding protein [Nocardioides sp.]|nr:AMP-binding protein [Nocardioides sp.]
MSLLLSAPALAPEGLVLDLAGHGSRTAIRTADEEISYAELDRRSRRFADEVLGSTRRLVLIEGANRPEAITAYLAAVQHGHVALLVPDGRGQALRQLVDAYDPDVVVHREGDRWHPVERRTGSAHDLHPDLALLLSTSGSTGSPKLVRLSHENLRSNAEAIASYLRITEDDRAATSLPLHYCYGLSVVNSHLASGAALVLTEGSVVDECFWDLFTRAGATSFAGVPYTFDLLDRSGFAERHLPTLRQVTQAGGRLTPDQVRRYAGLGADRGWELVVMYGQTEATARMAYLPPELATRRPNAIGVPIPGGSFRIAPVPESPEPGTGELVYTGPNVMMGYAEDAADLAAGAVVEELRTGDLARFSDGLYEIVGRRSRHAKVFGLRIDLDRVEGRLSTPQAPVRSVVVEEVLHVFTTSRRRSAALHREAAELCGLPVGAVRVGVLPELPLTPTGKPDHAALERQAELVVAASRAEEQTSADRPVSAESVRDDYALVLGRPDATVHSSFVDLGGDSLSYVELATRLGHRLGELPTGWHTRPIVELVAGTTSQRRWTRPVDTTVLLRGLAILAIVGTHANLFTLVGGAHLLLAVAGFNFARFQLAGVPRRARVRNGLVGIAQVAVPSAVFIGLVDLATGFYDAPTALFLNGALGADHWTDQWQFWFLEALIWTSLGAVGLLALPVVDRLERRVPFAFVATLLLGALALRYAWTGIEAGASERYTPGVVLWFFVLGWAAERTRTAPTRVLVAAVGALGVAGFFADPQRELVIATGVAVLVFVPAVRLPRQVAAALSVLASASLFVYLTHWQVYPWLEMDHPLLATLSSLAVGIAYWWLMRPAMRRLGLALRTGALTP